MIEVTWSAARQCHVVSFDVPTSKYPQFAGLLLQENFQSDSSGTLRLSENKLNLIRKIVDAVQPIVGMFHIQHGDKTYTGENKISLDSISGEPYVPKQCTCSTRDLMMKGCTCDTP